MEDDTDRGPVVPESREGVDVVSGSGRTRGNMGDSDSSLGRPLVGVLGWSPTRWWQVDRRGRSLDLRWDRKRGGTDGQGVGRTPDR